MRIGTWILSFVLMAIEAWGSVYFFGIFMERKRKGWLDKCRYMALYLATAGTVFFGEYLDSMGIKVLLIVLMHIVFCVAFYKANWEQCIFFPVLNYSLLFLTDFFSVQAENILMTKDEAYVSKLAFLALPAKLVWVLLLFMFRRIWKGKNSYSELTHKEWRKFGMVPLFTLVSMLLMINLLVMVLMKDILEKGELLRESALTDQKKESQLAHYRDMQAAATLAEGLTESISVEMSAVNTNHPVAEKVQVTDGIVLDSGEGMHGVGLMNVKAVVDKYGGDFAISCDREKFQAVVMI